jgi:hypothetical protein
MTCKTKLLLWYLYTGAFVVFSILLGSWCGLLGWIIPFVIFSLLFAFGVLVHPVPKAGNTFDKSSLGIVLEVLVIVVPVIGIIANLLVRNDNATSNFFSIILWAFRFVVLCLIVIVLMYLREQIRMAAKIDKELQSKADRN